MPRRPRGGVVADVIGRFHHDERGQSLAIILALITVLFLMGSALAAHTSVALRSTVANEAQAGSLNAADAGAELGMWWQRNNKVGNPPNITVNGLTVTTTVGITGAVPCDTPSLVDLTGFEHGVVSARGKGIFNAVNGTGLSADSGVTRSGVGYSLNVADAAGANNGELLFGTAVGVGVVRLYLRFASLPVANVAQLLVLQATAGNDVLLGYESSTRNLTLRFATQPTVLATSTVSAGIWYRLDLLFIANTSPRTVDWRIDGAVQPRITRTQTATTFKSIVLGSTVAGDAFNVNYDDVVVSDTGNDYPIGPGTIVALRPNGIGPSSIGAPAFRNDDGSGIDANTWQRLDGDPMSGAGLYVRQQTIGTTSYVEVTLEATVAPCIVGVSGILAYHSQTTAGNNGKTSFFDGALESVIFSGDMSETSNFYKSAIVRPAAGSWTTGAVNGLKARIGYSTDVTPNPYWEGLLLEVATGTPAVPGTVTVTSTASDPLAPLIALSQITTTYTDVGAASPTLLTWSATR